MIQYKKIGPYIVECSLIDDHTYMIALWYISDRSLDCELCELIHASSYEGAVLMWRSFCHNVEKLVRGKNPCSEGAVSLAQTTDTDPSEKGFPRLLRGVYSS